MILILLCVFIGAFALGYVTSLLAKGWPAYRPILKDANVPETGPGLWILTDTKQFQSAMTDTVRRVAELERARHEID